VSDHDQPPELHYIVYLTNADGKRLGSFPAYTEEDVTSIVYDILDSTLDIDHRIEIVRTK
jgi:hypothetical protein